MFDSFLESLLHVGRQAIISDSANAISHGCYISFCEFDHKIHSKSCILWQWYKESTAIQTYCLDIKK